MEYTVKDIGKITGKSNPTLFKFIKENEEFINQHSKRDGRFIKFDEEALQEFIKRFGKVETSENAAEKTQEHADLKSEDINTGSQQDAVIEAFEAQISALKTERDELAKKLEAREKDCEEWRQQAGLALNALSKEQERAGRLEERLAGYLPPPKEENKPKISLKERIKILFGGTINK